MVLSVELLVLVEIVVMAVQDEQEVLELLVVLVAQEPSVQLLVPVMYEVLSVRIQQQFNRVIISLV